MCNVTKRAKIATSTAWNTFEGHKQSVYKLWRQKNNFEKYYN